MRKITYWLLWLFVSSVAFEALSLPFIGRAPVALGMLLITVAVLTTVMEGQFRKPGAIVWLAIAFAIASGLSLLWTIAYPITNDRVRTFIQLVLVVWVIWEFARTKKQQESLLVAYILGMFVPLESLFRNFSSGAHIGDYQYRRYSATGYNADEIGLMCALTLPIAWHLMLTKRGFVRVMAATYLVAAPLGMILTGTRGAFLSSLVALSIIPLTLSSMSRRSVALAAIALVVAGGALATIVPGGTWARLFSIQKEAMEGSGAGRYEVWMAGLEVFQSRPVLGVGVGAFETAVYPLIGDYAPAHNTFIAVLAEQGLVGFGIFVGIIVACAGVIYRSPSPQRQLWTATMLSWLVGVMTVHWQYRKFTWLLFAFVAVQGALRPEVARGAEERAQPEPPSNASSWGMSVINDRPRSTIAERSVRR